MWGIAPVEPGYAKTIIKPQLSTLKYSKISVPTIRGNIEAEFKVTGKTKEYSITLPGNMKCDFVIPDVKNLTILFNGKKIKPDSGKIILKPGLNKIII